MRMSCNGCRVLRKGCSENCSIRPCLQWIKSPESQANATVFLAKFYGRAGLINLVNAGPEHLRPGKYTENATVVAFSLQRPVRPFLSINERVMIRFVYLITAIFRSLLYEACGRMVNPIYGSVGLLWSGTWSLCHNAVEAVLNGAPITPIASDSAECHNGPPLKAYDIRHVSKDDNSSGSKDLHRVRTRCRFKKSAAKPKPSSRKCDVDSGHDELNRSTSHDSSLSHQSEANAVGGESREVASIAPRAEPESERAEDGEVELELTLGLEPVSRSRGVSVKGKTSELGFE
ncbi:hypothetical protein RHSIM_Rhsim08G0082300 [Rhododendron simsii]|uniref:LOB domain-containing protein n=1 Tax=Rhododendron simsii TaxID=118357 RepID=A0A834LF86_RHOSS|nr:hypothetical protein RHSIM_Rhsim08G0082300 [Rhododendron simsii]